MADITMPQLGETVTEGTITRWAKQVGDRIEEDEILFEVSTDKVDSEVPSPVSGVRHRDRRARGRDRPRRREARRRRRRCRWRGSGGRPRPPSPRRLRPRPRPRSSRRRNQPRLRKRRPPHPRRRRLPLPQPEPAPAPAPAAEAGAARVRRRRAEQGALAGRAEAHRGEQPRPVSISGTGAGGRITRADVLAALDAGAGKARARAGGPDATGCAGDANARGVAAACARRGVRGRRRGSATRRFRSPTSAGARPSTWCAASATSAHTLVVIEVDYDNVEKVRNKEKGKFKEPRASRSRYLPFIARAVVDAIREFPHVNASVGNDELIVHGDVNLGIAVDLNFEGLIVPVVHDADGKRLRALAREIADLASKARTKKLGADDIAGGTFTITNAGGYGTLITGPIINQPQVAILSTDGVKPQPVAVPLDGGSGYGIAVHPVGNLAISFDHRAFDGAYAAAFLAKIREILETRDWATELA